MIDRSLNYGRDVLARFLAAGPKPQNVLDIGAGHGDDLMILRQANPQARLSAVECYPEYIRQLKDLGITVHAIDIEREKLPFAPESLDWIIANQILEHTKEIFWILDQVSRVLCVGGTFYIGVPNLAALHNRVLLMVGRQPSPLKNNSAHVRGYTKSDVRNVFESAFPGGYELKAFGGGNFYPFPPLLARPLARLLPGMAASIFFQFVKRKPYQGEFLQYPSRMQLETNFFVGS